MRVYCTTDSINLGGLNSYGTSGQIIKVNSNADGLEFGDEDNTEYTVVSPLTKTVGNAISLSNLTGFGTEGQFLKAGANNALVYGTDNNTEYTAGTNINISGVNNDINLDTEINILSANITNNLLLGTTTNPNARRMVIEGTELIKALEIRNSSIFFTSGGGMIFNNDSNAVISRDSTNNLNQFGNIAGITEIFSLTGGKFTFPNSITIKIDGNALSELTLLRNTSAGLTNNDYLRIDSSGNVIGVQTIPYSDITGTPTIPTTLFGISGSNISPLNTTDNLLIGTGSNPNQRKVVIEGSTTVSPPFHYGALKIKNSSIFFKTLRDTDAPV